SRARPGAADLRACALGDRENPPAPRNDNDFKMINDPIQTLLKAASYAARKHSDQRRADGMTPYFAHVARVTVITRHLFKVADQDVLTAALLHDVIEDTNT